jgi:hypothetical protein
MNPTTAQIAYLKWVAQAHPDIYARARALAANRTDQLGALGGWVDSLINLVGQVGSEVLKKKASDKVASTQAKSDKAAVQLALLQANTQRVAAGLPPVDINGNVVATAQLPAPRPPGYAPVSSATLIPGVPNAVTYVGGAVAVLLLLKMLKVL